MEIECRVSVFVDPRPLEGCTEERAREAGEAAALLLRLPWDLLHDGQRGRLSRRGTARQRSLYASVELSLARLPPGVRRQIRLLGVFQGGANLVVFALMAGIEQSELDPIVRALLETNLAEQMPADKSLFCQRHLIPPATVLHGQGSQSAVVVGAAGEKPRIRDICDGKLVRAACSVIPVSR